MISPPNIEEERISDKQTKSTRRHYYQRARYIRNTRIQSNHHQEIHRGQPSSKGRPNHGCPADLNSTATSNGRPTRKLGLGSPFHIITKSNQPYIQPVPRASMPLSSQLVNQPAPQLWHLCWAPRQEVVWPYTKRSFSPRGSPISQNSINNRKRAPGNGYRPPKINQPTTIWQPY